ncbi:MAG: Kae1-associated serine/threonine protein kinase [Nitrosopumilus sp. D6]|nr:MAG: Kae1-associated serine/threonine protein kinase [Nitrosopumilus sp. D6]
MKLVQTGAEADIYRTQWLGSDAILKVRKPKEYRNHFLDSQIRRQRTIKESQMLSHAKSIGIPAPLVYFVDVTKSSIIMQRIPGRPVHDLPGSRIILLSKTMGRLAGIMHKNSIIHGDLTTSNFLLCDGSVFVVDFGLSQNSSRLEDHAVDLRLIKEILNSAHAAVMKQAWKNFVSGYGSAVGSATCSQILELVSEIEGRGRYATVV